MYKYIDIFDMWLLYVDSIDIVGQVGQMLLAYRHIYSKSTWDQA
jgi:hypothetical protein